MIYARTLLLILIFDAVRTQDLPCLEQLSVNISGAEKWWNGIIVKDGVQYDTSNYYVKNGVTWGCICNVKNCIQKCCGEGENLIKKKCVKQEFNNEFNISVFDGTNRIDYVKDFAVLYGKKCVKEHVLIAAEPTDLWYLQRNGTLYVQFVDSDATYNLGYYCFAPSISGEGLRALLCEYYPQEAVEREVKILARGMIISMPFLLITFVVYAILPDSNLHRKALMFYVLTLLLSYIFLVTVQLYEGKFQEFMCQTLGYSVIFFFIGSFFWMNVMCIDMWLAFSGLRGFNGQKHAERKRFLIYCAYAWGMPVLHVLIVFLVNTYGDPDQPTYPAVGRTKCFLDDGLPNLLYFYGPMAIITGINIVLFILTAIKIQKVKKETSVLKHTDSKRHSYEDDKQKFNLYLKLLFAMGINWSMEIISWAFLWKMGNQVPSYVWYLTDFCNAMYGVFIFFIFVFKKKIWKSLQKRYYVFIGKPHLAHSLTTTQTTRSSNFSTTETGLNEHRLSEIRNGREERALTQN